MSKEIKQKADDLVGLFSNNQIYLIKNRLGKLTSPYKSGYLAIKTREYESIKCAILHQERLIEELVLNSGYVSDFYKFNYLDTIKIQKEILTELKSRL